MSKRAQHQCPDTAKWTQAIVHFIIYTCARPTATCRMSSVKMTYSTCSTLGPQLCSNWVLIEFRSTWVQLHSTHGAAGLHQSAITLACFVLLKNKATTKNSNPPPADESMEFLTKLPESHLMVQQALMQSQYKLFTRGLLIVAVRTLPALCTNTICSSTNKQKMR